MKIYIAHSKKLNYKENLYYPIRADKKLQEYEILLPHEETAESNNLREFYKELSVMIAEVSYPGTGMGIELGWAYDDGVPIYCIYKQGTKLSRSLEQLNPQFMEYTTEEELLDVIKKIIMEIEEKQKEK